MSNLATQQPNQVGFFSVSNMDDAWSFAKTLATSNLVPENFKNKPSDILIAMQMGSEIGLKPMQSLQSIAVIRGKPTIWGDSLVAICQGSGLLQDIVEDVTETYATVTVTRVGQESHTVTFSQDDAKKAGLWGNKGPWSSYPKRMMKNRARAFALRDKFADVLSGFGITEEEKDRVLDVSPSRPNQSASPINASINSLLETIPEAPVIEYYDTHELLETIAGITDSKQVAPIGKEIGAMLNDPAINIKDDDVNELRQALADKKKSIALSDEYDNIMKHVKECESLDDVERMRGLIADKEQDFDAGDIKMLNDTLDIVSEDIGAQG